MYTLGGPFRPVIVIFRSLGFYGPIISIILLLQGRGGVLPNYTGFMANPEYNGLETLLFRALQ